MKSSQEELVMHPVRSLVEMESHLASIRQSPSDEGIVEMIVSRPITGGRQVMDNADLNVDSGLVGDNWVNRKDKHTSDGKADPGRQLTLMNSRIINAITESAERWPEAGDQFFVDFDLSDENLPPGTRLGIGQAVIEVSALPHLGCFKFGKRFGKEANQFVNSAVGQTLNLRGINAKVITAGVVAPGDPIRKVI
ncbi:MOSC domain-containing protein [Gammaproteobacteria bacterium]|nr:MOSC domain-containing protein [Gammaproteobacteria bacterium]